MSMMRSDFDELDAQLVDSSKVLEGYIYLSEEIAQQKTAQQKVKRKRLICALLSVSVGVFLWDNHFFIERYESLESYHAAPALGDVLADGVVEQLQPETAVSVSDSQLELNVDIPEDIVKFIDAELFVNKDIVVSKGVLLEELKQPEKNTINIDKILASGNKLFKRDRLMSPPEHNAFARYEKILSINPEHPGALKGIENIVNRYVFLAKSVIAKNEEYKVAGLIQKAYQAGEKYIDVSVIIEQFSNYLSNDSIFSEIVSKNHDLPIPNGNIASQETMHTDQQGGSSVFIADKKISQAAYALYLKGDTASAEKVLKNFTQLSGFWGESNDFLLKMYLSEARIAQAENLIYENKALDPYQFAEKAARVMMTRGDHQGALGMLSAYRPEFLDNKAYYVLLASLYHKVGNFQRSTYWYRQLLSVNHKDARLWLGLAVSLDALNDIDGALQAFEYVRLYAQNDSAVKQYINERRLALAD